MERPAGPQGPVRCSFCVRQSDAPRTPKRVASRTAARSALLVEHPNVWAIELAGHRLGIGDGSAVSLEHWTVEAGENADDLVPVTLDHDPSADDLQPSLS